MALKIGYEADVILRERSELQAFYYINIDLYPVIFNNRDTKTSKWYLKAMRFLDFHCSAWIATKWLGIQLHR